MKINKTIFETNWKEREMNVQCACFGKFMSVEGEYCLNRWSIWLVDLRVCAEESKWSRSYLELLTVLIRFCIWWIVWCWDRFEMREILLANSIEPDLWWQRNFSFFFFGILTYSRERSSNCWQISSGELELISNKN